MSELISNHNDAVLSDADDAQWLAMRYVLGELSDEESDTFEAAMEANVALCEGVLQATLLNSVVSLAYESQTSGRPALVAIGGDELNAPRIAKDRSSFARFGVFVATSAMLLVVLAMVLLQNSPQSKVFTSADDATADMLAMLLHNASSSDMNGEFDEFSASDDSVSSLVAPEWLLTAVDLDAIDGQEEIPVIRPEDESGVY